MFSSDLSQSVLRVKFVKPTELKTKLVVSMALESIIYKKKQNKKKNLS